MGSRPILGTAALFEGASNIGISGGNFIAVQAGGNVLVNVLPATIDEDEVLKLLDTLETKNFRTIHNDNYDKRVPGSGRWFIESDLLQDWAHGRSPGKILWVVGNAGAGKTILASTIIAELEKLERQSSEGTPGSTALAYIYCRYTEKMLVEDMLLAMVRQQLERNFSLAPLVKPLIDKHKREKTKPSQHELLNLLNEISRRFKTTYYVLDALDEAPPDVRFGIVEALASVNARFFITSRPLGHLQRDFARFTTFTTLTAQKVDIDLLIDRAIRRDPGLRALIQENGLREEIESTIYENCGGMFLHASLQLKALSLCSNIDDVRHTLSTFPPEIDAFYDQCFERANSQSERQVRLAMRALACIVSAQRDLTLEELQIAISYDAESRRFGAITSADHLLPLLCGLVTVDVESKVVRLVHYTALKTVKTHLQRDPFHADLHAHLAYTCIAYLIENNFPDWDYPDDADDDYDGYDLREALKSEPFSLYAHDNWDIHAHQSSSPSVEEFCTDFFLKCKTFPIVDGDFIMRLRGIHMAAMHNFVNPLRDILSKFPAEVNREDGFQRTALMWAAVEGHTACVRLLLEVEGIDVNLLSAPCETALSLARSARHQDCVRLLMDVEGIEINPRAILRRWIAQR